jgi:hypothetical protein
MKAQSKASLHCRKNPSPSGRIHPQADIREQHSVSAQPTPVIRTQGPFTTEEHLRVQGEIEHRARRFWFEKGCALNCALNDWLKAENEVLTEFAKMLMQHQQMQPVSSKAQTKTEKTPTWPPTVPYQPMAKVNPKLTAAFQHLL